MKQQTFSDIEYSHRRKKTKREEFLEAMDQIIPWQHWIDLIKDYYPKGVLSFNTPDALRLAKPNQTDKQRVEWFFEETSK